ncbi:hypothetical protein ACHAPT_012016 [Fusarium lateritium]
MSSLSILDSQMSHLSVSDDDMDDNSSQCSHYSLSDLEDDEWLLRIPASEVRRQAKLVPETPSRGVKYPKQFFNKEELPVKASGTLKEYPVCLNSRYLFGDPGPARIIVNPSQPDSFDVVYHRNRQDRGFVQAKYRPKGYKSKAKPKPVTPPSPTLGQDWGLAYPPSSPNPGVYGTYSNTTYFPPPQIPNNTLYQQDASQNCPNFWTSSYLHTPTMLPILQYTPGFYPMGFDNSQYQY